MTGHAIVDVVAVVLILAAVLSGWRQGLIAAIFTALGSVAGLVAGYFAALLAVNYIDGQGMRTIVFLSVVVVFVGLGNLAGSYAGDTLRPSARWLPARALDSVAGAALQAIATALALWIVTVPLISGLPEQPSEALRQSRVLSLIDATIPESFVQLPAKMSSLLHETGMPPLVSPFRTDAANEVDAPNPDAVTPELVEASRPSVVHVVGDSQTCHHRLMGSGFVIAEDYVLTNAHVVAGTQSVSLDTVVGAKPADVVFYDPEVDIAVLHATQLGLPELQWSERELRHGSDAVVMGFPDSGPFAATAARVRSKLEISGPDIYTTGRIERSAYTIRGDVRQGNSGGPLLDTEGQVAGMIFGTATDVDETGYALTGAQVRERVGEIEKLITPVDTRSCVVG